MYAVISPQQIRIPPGSIMRLPGSWVDYRSLRESRGDQSVPRLKFCCEKIWLMSPLPQHGREANLIADILKALLDQNTQTYEAFTPVTIELPGVGGIEPDYCFYITHWQAVLGRDRMDWSNTPPPELVIEIDVTSYTAVNDYLPYQIPEVWIYGSSGLRIYALHVEGYQSQSVSRFFPDVDLPKLITAVFRVAQQQGAGAAIQDLRRQLS